MQTVMEQCMNMAKSENCARTDQMKKKWSCGKWEKYALM
jgi:hypothetical protein